MKKTKKFLSIVFLASCISALPSCGGNQVHYDINNFLINGTDENPYQIVKEPVTIKIFAPHAQGNPDFETLKMFKYLEKITNLKFVILNFNSVIHLIIILSMKLFFSFTFLKISL